MLSVFIQRRELALQRREMRLMRREAMEQRKAAQELAEATERANALAAAQLEATKHSNELAAEQLEIQRDAEALELRAQAITLRAELQRWDELGAARITNPRSWPQWVRLAENPEVFRQAEPPEWYWLASRRAGAAHMLTQVESELDRVTDELADLPSSLDELGDDEEEGDSEEPT